MNWLMYWQNKDLKEPIQRIGPCVWHVILHAASYYVMMQHIIYRFQPTKNIYINNNCEWKHSGIQYPSTQLTNIYKIQTKFLAAEDTSRNLNTSFINFINFTNFINGTNECYIHILNVQATFILHLIHIIHNTVKLLIILRFLRM
jgi:hypothetical protein